MSTVNDAATEWGPRGDEAGLPDRMNAAMWQACPRMHELGIRVVELRAGFVVGAVPLAGNRNHLGTMYAGALFGVAEMLGGALWLPSFDPERFYPTVKDLQIRYRRPATTDVRAQAQLDTATIDRMRRDTEARGKTEFVLDAVLTDTAAEVVATTRGIYQIRAR
jgi:thioesterase domain-containing protein